MRFRESQTPTIDTHFNTLASTKSKIESLHDSNLSLHSRLETLRSQRASQETATRDKQARNTNLKTRLLELKKAQERVALDMERVRKTKADLTARLAEKTEATLALQKECERLSPYASQSSAALQAQLNELSASLTRDKASAETLARRQRALQTSSASFAAAAADVSPLLTQLRGTAADLGAEEAEAAEAAKRREALGQRGLDVRAVERQEASLTKQVAEWEERTRTMRRKESERAEKDARRMRELRGEYEGLAVEREKRGREVESRRVRVEQTEKKVC